MRIPFHQYQRYKMIEIIVNSIRQNDKPYKILEVGANEHKNLERFLHSDEIVYLDLKLSEKLKNDPQYVEGDATNMSFADNSFDIVIALDVLEHITENKRCYFFNELNRVSKHGFIISAPFKGFEVEEAEKRINDFYSTLYDDQIIWHKEHVKNGYPELDNSLNYIKEELNLNYTVIRHGSTYIWEKFMRMELVSGTNPNAYKYWEDVNEYYNNEIFERDFNDKCVRNFIIAFKNKVLVDNIEDKIGKTQKNMTEEYYYKIDDLEKSLYNLIYTLGTMNKVTNYVDKFYFQLFIDDGNGYNEENSFKYEFKLDNRNLCFEKYIDISRFKLIKGIRIDPINEQCYIKINMISLVDKSGRVKIIDKFKTNAEFYVYGKYLFLTIDPQIFVEIDKNVEVKGIKVSYEFINYGFNIDADLIRLLNKSTNRIDESEKQLESSLKKNKDLSDELGICVSEKKEMEQVIIDKDKIIEDKDKIMGYKDKAIEDKDKIIKEKEEKIYYLEKEISKIKNSTIWKMSKLFNRFNNTSKR